jgi:hypothetical protein
VDCPTCGLTNPAESLRCDCGYDFAAKAPDAVVGLKAELTWNQRLAAFWSIVWPAALVAVLGIVVSAMFHADVLIGRCAVVRLTAPMAFQFLLLALFSRRLVQKDYRTFRIYILREGLAEESRTLSWNESITVGLRVIAPQVVFWVVIDVLWLFTSKLSTDDLRGVDLMVQILGFLVVGPFSIGFALRGRYSGFELQSRTIR